MTAAAKHVLELALELPEDEREHVADSIWRSAHGCSDAELEEEWNKEIARRVADIDSGEAEFIPHEHVMAEVRRKYLGK
jgi:putative addiction module component (TIGR02574 family)